MADYEFSLVSLHEHTKILKYFNLRDRVKWSLLGSSTPLSICLLWLLAMTDREMLPTQITHLVLLMYSWKETSFFTVNELLPCSSGGSMCLTLTYLFVHCVQVRSRTGARGKAATGGSHVPMSWRVTSGSTPEPNPSSAPCAAAASLAPIISPCIWRGTRIRHKHTLTETDTYAYYYAHEVITEQLISFSTPRRTL